jgi:hypothetical protein
VKQDRQLFPLVVTGDNAVTASYGHTELLQLCGIHPGQGIQACGIYELIMTTLQRIPLYMSRVFSAQEELGVKGKSGQEQ